MRAGCVVAAVVAATVAACAPPVSGPAGNEGQRPSGFPATYYMDAARRGQPVYQIDPVASRVVIEVRRAGALAQLGHDHVVVSRDVVGYVAPNEGRADFYLRLDRMVVDEPGERAGARFDGQPPDDAIAGTRENMLRKLNATEHPYAVVGVRGVGKDAARAWLEATIAVNGIERAMRIPATIAFATEEASVAGEVTLAQTAFGIVPYSILGGALQVQDAVAIRFRVRARRMPM